ncbi:MAG TPA: hypothetical protein VGG28_22505 [Kofleriaceae bacterium]
MPARIERERYFAELDYLELSALFTGPLKPSVLAKWKEIAPAGAIGLVAPFVVTHRKAPDHAKPWPSDASTGDYRDSPLSRSALEAFVAAIDAVAAGSAVFRSADDFSPSASNRDQLAKFFGEIATREVVHADRVWVPGGLWGVRTAAKVATELGLTLAIDPLVHDPSAPEERYEDLEVPSLYFRIENAGRTGLIRNEKLEDFAALLEHYESLPTTVAFASPERWQDARNFKKLLEI